MFKAAWLREQEINRWLDKTAVVGGQNKGGGVRVGDCAPVMRSEIRKWKTVLRGRPSGVEWEWRKQTNGHRKQQHPLLDLVGMMAVPERVLERREEECWAKVCESGKRDSYTLQAKSHDILGVAIQPMSPHKENVMDQTKQFGASERNVSPPITLFLSALEQIQKELNEPRAQLFSLQ